MLKLQYFDHLIKNWLIRKDPDAGKDWRQEKGMKEDEMVGWHHRFFGREFDQILGNGEGQGSLACCSPWGHKELDNWATEQQQNITLLSVYTPFCVLSFLCTLLSVYTKTCNRPEISRGSPSSLDVPSSPLLYRLLWLLGFCFQRS